MFLRVSGWKQEQMRERTDSSFIFSLYAAEKWNNTMSVHLAIKNQSSERLICWKEYSFSRLVNAIFYSYIHDITSCFYPHRLLSTSKSVCRWLENFRRIASTTNSSVDLYHVASWSNWGFSACTEITEIFSQITYWCQAVVITSWMGTHSCIPSTISWSKKVLKC